MELAVRNSRLTSMSLYFDTIGVINPWPLFRPYSVLERDKSPRLTAAFEVLWIWLKLPIVDKHTYCGLLKQPYKHKTAKCIYAQEVSSRGNRYAVHDS